MNEDVDTDTKLDVALSLMTQEQYNAWEQSLQIIQLQCELTDARRAIQSREYAIEQLQQQLDTAQTLLRGETSE